MLVSNIIENSSYTLDPEHALQMSDILRDNPTLPLTLKDQVLFFDEYTIGEFRIGDLAINIQPRNTAFTLTSFFQILQFLNRALLDELPGYGFDDSHALFDLKSISKTFCVSINALLQFGLTGHYHDRSEYSFQVKSDINFDNYVPQLVPYNGINSKLIEYSLNSRANKIIKSALVKLVLLEHPRDNPQKSQILRELENIEEEDFTIDQIDDSIAELFSSNPHYVICLELAKKILNDLQLAYKNGEVEWLAFLENSNTMFEKYVLKILDETLPVRVQKWDKPKECARLSAGDKLGVKAFSPDILLNYDQNTGKALAVLDVKNKSFEPSKKQDLNDVISSNDLYQLIFYCNQLKTKLGGLIYPSSTSNDPIRLTIDSKDNITLYLFSVNMKQDMKTRHSALSNDVTTCILNNS
jgi:5-methylcytosine-specific restriction enzyme subunit McrC